jgi:hypothetical protein
MEDNVLPTIENIFSDFPDPRMDRTKLHNLLKILVIAICAIVAGTGNYEDLADFG